jgi:hypothetical protein
VYPVPAFGVDRRDMGLRVLGELEDVDASLQL